MDKGIQSSLWANKFRSVFLIVLFPIFLRLIITIAYTVYITYQYQESLVKARNQWLLEANNAFMFLGPIILLRWIISFFFYRQIIFKFSWAKVITRQENPKIYNIVENLCISKGLPTPKIWIIEDDSLNAFATGRNMKNAWIVFSKWLIDKLNQAEIESVAAHELTHIINKDSLVMIIIVVFVWAIWTLGQILIRVRGGNKDKWNPLPLIWLALLILWYLIYPLIQLSISRKREYLADAWSVEITKDKYAMISALQKISQDPIIESIKKDTIAAMCIQTPFAQTKKWWLSSILSTHPSIENRIQALEKY